MTKETDKEYIERLKSIGASKEIIEKMTKTNEQTEVENLKAVVDVQRQEIDEFSQKLKEFEEEIEKIKTYASSNKWRGFAIRTDVLKQLLHSKFGEILDNHSQEQEKNLGTAKLDSAVISPDTRKGLEKSEGVGE